MTNSKILARFFPSKSATVNQEATLYHRTAAFDLVRQAIDQEKRKFEAIYEGHHRPVYRLFFLMTQNADVAEDLTQEVFVKLFKNLKCRDNCDLNMQILRLAINDLLLYLISDDERFSQLKNPKFDGILENDVQQRAEPTFNRGAMKNVIAQLPIDFRLIFLLHDFEHLNHQEIARILKIDIETSKLNLHEARHKLRCRLAE